MSTQHINKLFVLSYGEAASKKLSVAVHKFSSCDGCQLALLNLGEGLLALSKRVDIKHFAEAGPVDELAAVDIAFIEGSISTSADLDRIKAIRANSIYLITIGACATAGGLQALRNFSNVQTWTSAIYASPEYIDSLDNVSPIKNHVHVDFEIWGCPVSSQQIVKVFQSLLSGVSPIDINEKACQECKRNNTVCVMVAKGEPCMGVVTRAGCGALCPSLGRACYACYGPAKDLNTDAIAKQFNIMGMSADQIGRKFIMINNTADKFTAEARKWRHD